MLDDDPTATQPPVTTPSCPICFYPTRARRGKHQLACVPCGHVGGFDCLVACAQKHAACAVCRAPVRASDVTRLWLPNAVDACASSDEDVGEDAGAPTARDENAAPVVVWGPWKRARTDERRADDRVGGVGLMGGDATVRVAEVSSRTQSECCERPESASVAPDGKSLLYVEYTRRKEGDGRVRLFRSSLSRRSVMVLFERSYERRPDYESYVCYEDQMVPRIVVPSDSHRARREARHFMLLLGYDIYVFVDSINEFRMVYHLEVDEIRGELIKDAALRQTECGHTGFASFIDAGWSTSPREVKGDENQNVFYVTTRVGAANDVAYAVHRVDMRRPRSCHLQKVYFIRYKNCAPVHSFRESPAAFLCSNNGLGIILTLDELPIWGHYDLAKAKPSCESCEIFRSLRSTVPCVPLARLLKPIEGPLGRIQGFFASNTYSTGESPHDSTPDWLLVCYGDGGRTRVEKVPSADGALQGTRSSVFDRDARHFDDALQKMSFLDPSCDGFGLRNLLACHIGGKDVFVGVSYQRTPKKEDDAATKLFVYAFGAREDPIIVPLSERNDEPVRFDVVRSSASEALVYVRLAAKEPIEHGSSSERSITEKVFTLRC